MLDNDELRWYHLAVCKEMNLNWFYEDYEADPVFAQNMDDICFSCPVRAQCLREGIEENEHGLWGGVYLTRGRMDPDKNAHKTEEVWKRIKDAIR